jgi:hypothetical protein
MSKYPMIPNGSKQPRERKEIPHVKGNNFPTFKKKQKKGSLKKIATKG